LKNAGIAGDSVIVRVQAVPPRLDIFASGSTVDGQTQELTFEHPSLLHVPDNLVEVFGKGASLIARIDPKGGCVTIKDVN